MVTGLKALCQKHHISVRQLSAICGGTKGRVSATSAHRLIHGIADGRYVTKIWPHVAMCLSLFLASRGVSNDEIKSDIRAAFPEINPETNGTQSATLIIRSGEGRIIHVHEYEL